MPNNIVDNLVKSLKTYATNILDKKRLELSKTATKIDTLSPMKIIARGYSITQKDGKTIKRANDLNLGDNISIKYIDGSIKANVVEKHI